MEIQVGLLNKLVWSIEFILLLRTYIKRFSNRLLADPPTPDGFINFLLRPDVYVFDVDGKGLIWIYSVDINEKTLFIGCLAWKRTSLEIKKLAFEEALENFSNFEVFAEVKNENQLSHKLVKELGFKVSEQLSDRVIYIYQKED